MIADGGGENVDILQGRVLINREAIWGKAERDLPSFIGRWTVRKNEAIVPALHQRFAEVIAGGYESDFDSLRAKGLALREWMEEEGYGRRWRIKIVVFVVGQLIFDLSKAAQCHSISHQNTVKIQLTSSGPP